MSDHRPHSDTIRRFWETTEARDWAGLSTLLSPDLVYEMEQTRERVRGREAFLRFFQEFPGDWHATTRRVIADDEGSGVSVVDFVVGGESMTGITFFRFDGDGLVVRLEDVWPEPYDRPESRAHLTELF
jgi:ketosteroid isomerase-like protein